MLPEASGKPLEGGRLLTLWNLWEASGGLLGGFGRSKDFAKPLGGFWESFGGHLAVAVIWEEFDRKSKEFHRETIELLWNLKDFFEKPSNY